MRPEKTIQFLKLLGAKTTSAHKRTGWIVSDCPLGPWNHEGGKSSPEVFGVKQESGDARCNCFACGWHGTMTDLILEIKVKNKTQPRGVFPFGEAKALVEEAENDAELNLDSPDIEEVLFGKKERPAEFPQWWLDSFPPATEVAWGRQYLKERNVPAALAVDLDLRADTEQKRLCFPVRDFDGTLMGLHGRAVPPDTEPRYRMYTYAKKNNPIIWLGESWVDLSRPIVVVEGPFDLASVKRVYGNVVSPLFVNPSEAKLKRMSDAIEWITLYDNGAGGNAGRAKVDKVLGETHVVHHLKPPKGRKDPGEMMDDELRQLLGSLAQLTAKNT